MFLVQLTFKVGSKCFVTVWIYNSGGRQGGKVRMEKTVLEYWKGQVCKEYSHC